MPSRSLDDLKPEFRALIEKLIQRMDALGFPVYPIGTLRSPAEQDALYARGRTTGGLIVTYKKGGESPHNFGLAVDFLFIHEKWRGPWSTLGREAKKLGLVWGGDFKFRDLDHVELANWRSHVNVIP